LSISTGTAAAKSKVAGSGTAITDAALPLVANGARWARILKSIAL
jgi:hypothetical protein